MLYFAFGSNIDVGQMRRRCPSARLQASRLALSVKETRSLGERATNVTALSKKSLNLMAGKNTFNRTFPCGNHVHTPH
jgi:hypothetical protein